MIMKDPGRTNDNSSSSSWSEVTTPRGSDGYRGSVDGRGTKGQGAARRTVAVGVALGLVSVLSLVAVIEVFLSEPGGQRIDETALRGARIGQGRIMEQALATLHLVSGVGLVLATLAIALVAALRRRLDLALAAVAIVGAGTTTGAGGGAGVGAARD